MPEDQNEVSNVSGKDRNPRKLSPEESEEIGRKLANPDMRPGDFDGNLEAWLFRISLWGELSISHNDPENGVKGRAVSKEEFLGRVGDVRDSKDLGLWEIRQDTRPNALTFYRKYTSYNGRTYTEEFDLYIKLKDSLQKALDEHRHKGFLGGVKKLFGL